MSRTTMVKRVKKEGWQGIACHGIAMVRYDIAIVYSNDIGMTTTMITLERIAF